MLVLGSNHSNHSSLQWLSVCFIIDFQIFTITFKTFDLFANYSRNVAQMSLYVVKNCWFSSNVCKNIFLKSSFLFFYCDLLGFTHWFFIIPVTTALLLLFFRQCLYCYLRFYSTAKNSRMCYCSNILSKWDRNIILSYCINCKLDVLNHFPYHNIVWYYGKKIKGKNDPNFTETKLLMSKELILW